jgi:hypothetical protein
VVRRGEMSLLQNYKNAVTPAEAGVQTSSRRKSGTSSIFTGFLLSQE